MKPIAPMKRRFLPLVIAATWWLGGGCTSLTVPATKPIEEPTATSLEEEGSRVMLVRDLAGTWGMKAIKVEAIALVTGLNSTGSDPAPGQQREMLINEMKIRGVKRPHAVLSMPTTSMVMVRGFLPPGVRKGDRFDVQVIVPPRSETTSLKSGWLMETRLQEMAILGGQLHTGQSLGVAQGYVLIDGQAENSDDLVAQQRGMVLGGGVAMKERPLGLAMRSEHKSVRTATLVGAAVNARFHMFDRANHKKGVAKPLRDNYIELDVYPRYKNNIWRYVRVVGCIPVKESVKDRVERMELLRKQLADPTTAGAAALKLEAIGKDAVDVLREGLQSPSDEVRFYAAEALAYLDVGDSAAPLADLARREPAFRWHALTALSAMDDMNAYDQLMELLHVESAETRYGAFHALRARSGQDPLIAGKDMDGKFRYHVIGTSGPPLVHIARSRAAEVVVFGNELELQLPLMLLPDKHLTLKSLDNGQIRISRFAPNKEDKQLTCSNKLDDVLRTMVAVGASYPDVVAVLQMAKQKGHLNARVVVDALPKPGRTYDRPTAQPGEAPEVGRDIEVASPLPNLFTTYNEGEKTRGRSLVEDDLPGPPEETAAESENPLPEPKPEQPWWDVFGRMKDE